MRKLRTSIGGSMVAACALQQEPPVQRTQIVRDSAVAKAHPGIAQGIYVE